MQKQSVIRHQISILFALFIRDNIRKFSDHKLGALWILLEPILMILAFMLIFGMRGRGEFGYIEPPLFILAAFLPFKHFFMKTMKECGNAINSKKQLSQFSQISFFDILVSKTLGLFSTGIAAGLIIAFMLYWLLGLNSMPKDILGVFMALLLMSLFGLSFGLMISMVRDIAKEIGVLVDLMTLPLLFMSAVFYPMSLVPEPYRSYLAYNPLVHPMEFIRETWFDRYVSPVVDMEYFAAWFLCACIFSLMVYRVRRKKVVMK